METFISRLNRNLNSADLLGVLIVAVLIGFERQRLADSGQIIREKIITSITITTIAYLLAFLVTRSSRFKAVRIPQWMIMGISGGICCSFALHVLYYLVANRQYGIDKSFFQYVWLLLPNVMSSFLATSFIYSLVTLVILALIRLCLIPKLAETGG